MVYTTIQATVIMYHMTHAYTIFLQIPIRNKRYYTFLYLLPTP